jgi:transposase
MADRDGGQLVLTAAQPEHPQLRHLWVDAAYRGSFVRYVQETLAWSVTVVNRPRRWGWYPVDVEPPPMPVFQVLPRRWVVERTFAWLGRYRRMSKDYEQLPEQSEALIYAGMSWLMVRRLAKQRSP